MLIGREHEFASVAVGVGRRGNATCHGHEISVAQPIRDVPANAQFYDLALEPAAGRSGRASKWRELEAMAAIRKVLLHFLAPERSTESMAYIGQISDWHNAKWIVQ
jgi:hypothetical protein